VRHLRFVTYLVELVLLSKQQISGGGAYPDCYPTVVMVLRMVSDVVRPRQTYICGKKPLLSV